MKKYLIQCRDVILYIVIDFDSEIGDEFRAGAFDFTVIEKPARSEALFCLEDEYGSLWHAWDYTGNNTCLVAHRLKQTKTVTDSALTDANDKDVASIDPGVGEKPEIEKVREQLAAANKRIKELEDFIVEFYDTVTRIN